MKLTLYTIVFLSFLSFAPGAWTQYTGALVGSTPGASLRNAAAATQVQAGAVKRAANDWGRRASWNSYRGESFPQDYQTLLYQFQLLRTQFNNTGTFALQLGRPRAANAVAELDAGLNIISELFVFLEQQYAAGVLDRATIARTCRAFEEAIGEWERELRKNSSRLGVVW